MNKQPYFIAISLTCLVAVLCLNLSPANAARAKAAISSFFIPLFSSQKAAESTGDLAVDILTPRKVLLREIGELRKTNQLLQLQITQAKNLELENAALRKQLQLPPKPGWKPRLGRIVGRDPANWWRSVQIDLGTQHGVKVDMPVMAADGLVGRVQEVHPKSSRVALLGDPACRISATVADTGESGILSAGGGTVFDPTLVDLLFLPAATEAQPGDRLYTSGLGDIFPRGIPVGKLLAVEASTGELTTTARVKLSVNPSKLNQVWVLMQ